MLKFDIEVFQRTAVFDVPADCMESAYAVVEQAYMITQDSERSFINSL